jgi:sugar-specific transcriptional regulator TrmB
VTKLSHEQQQLTQALCKLGLNLYQAKVYSALAALGPSGVSDIQKQSGVPRTKIYEILDQLLDMGAVEFQSGRPIFYNAIDPALVIDRMRNSYIAAADDATRLFAEIQQTEKSSPEELVWTVRGVYAVRRKLALTIASAKKQIIMVEQYPPKLILSVASILKSQAQKNVGVNVICVVPPGQQLDDAYRKEDFIEYRRMSRSENFSFLGEETTAAFEKMITAILAKRSSLTIADDSEAFLYMPDLSDASKSAGLTLRIPGLPLVQRILFERIIQQGTTRIK